MRAERERGGARRPRDLRRLRRSAYASRWSDASSSDSDAWRHQARGLTAAPPGRAAGTSARGGYQG